MRKIKSVLYNWFYTTENGEEYTYLEVSKSIGELTVVKIIENEVKGKICYDAYYDNGTMERIFNASQVFYDIELNNKEGK